MSKSIKEQLENWCVHFNGIQNGSCKIGIPYSDVRIDKPYKFPCLNQCDTCDKRQMPTPEQVEQEIEEIGKAFLDYINKQKTPHRRG